jgi:hypothetical protein
MNSFHLGGLAVVNDVTSVYWKDENTEWLKILDGHRNCRRHRKTSKHRSRGETDQRLESRRRPLPYTASLYFPQLLCSCEDDMLQFLLRSPIVLRIEHVLVSHHPRRALVRLFSEGRGGSSIDTWGKNTLYRCIHSINV